MGKYFVMSVRFNKHIASDFGFVDYDENSAINPQDGSTWIKKSLYDFGWGKENGYYKSPLPEFSVLLNLVLDGIGDDDIYGAAAIILEKYPSELLCKCEDVINDKKKKKEFDRLAKVFKLEQKINRSPIQGKSPEQIQNDFERWKKISEIALNHQKERGFTPIFLTKFQK